MSRGGAGTFPIVAFRVGGQATWGTEAVMLSAGTCIEWLRDDLGIIATSQESETVAAQCATAGDVWFVPALLGLGTPVWDFGARGHPRRPHPRLGPPRDRARRARRRGAPRRRPGRGERGDSGFPIAALRIDGGMSDNDVFVQALADAIGRPVEISPVLEATTLGAGLLAGLAVGTYATTDRARRHVLAAADGRAAAAATPTVSLHAIAGWRPGSKAEGTIPELSGISF